MAARQERVRGDGTVAHRVVYRLDRKQRVETFDDKRAADTFQKNLDDYGPAVALELLNAHQRAETIRTVAEFVDHHIDLVPNATAGTLSNYRAINDRDIRPHLIGRLPVDQLDRTTVEKWVMYLSRDRKLSAKTIKNIQALLSAAMTRAVRDGVRASNPCVGIQPPASKKIAHVYLTGSEFGVLRDNMVPRYRPLLGFLYGTGMRWAEATALEVRDIDLAGTPPTAHVRQAWKAHHGGPHELGPPKTDAGNRHVALPPQLVTLLEPLVDDRDRDAFVFTNSEDGPVRENSFHGHPWTPAVDKAEPLIHKRPRIHDLRHSHASNMIRQGVPLNIIQRRLGHEKITTTLDTYGHLAEDHLSVAAQAAALSLTDAFPEIEA